MVSRTGRFGVDQPDLPALFFNLMLFPLFRAALSVAPSVRRVHAEVLGSLRHMPMERSLGSPRSTIRSGGFATTPRTSIIDPATARASGGAVAEVNYFISGCAQFPGQIFLQLITAVVGGDADAFGALGAPWRTGLKGLGLFISLP